MERRTIVITGASDGIGAAAARELADHGHEIAVVGRNRSKTEAVARATGGTPFVADYAHLDEVRTLADELTAAYPRIDVLANNAGGMLDDRRMSDDGFEMTFQVNHLGGYLLTRLLMPALTANDATVIQTSSRAAKHFSRFDIDDLQLERGYSAFRAYGNGKLANILFTRELQRRHGSDGIAAVAFHPGVVGSSFGSASTRLMRVVYQNPLAKRFLTTSEEGADQLVWFAESEPGDWQPGEYYVKRRVASSDPIAADEGVARRLWEMSAEMVGLEP